MTAISRSKQTHQIHFFCDDSLYERIVGVAQRLDRPLSRVMRSALDAYCGSVERDRVPRRRQPRTAGVAR
jgi:hypothetical protein